MYTRGSTKLRYIIMALPAKSRRHHAPMARTQHYITVKQREDLRVLSEYTGVSASEHLRSSLNAYLSRPAIRAILATES